MATIINLAQDFVGSNNINLLMPNGQFGTRDQGGKDHASARYIFTEPSPVARAMMHPHDDPLLNNLEDDTNIIEPEYYMPVLPMILVNGAEGIGTGRLVHLSRLLTTLMCLQAGARTSRATTRWILSRTFGG